MNKDRLLKKYLHAELTPSEEEHFLQYLESDTEFAEDVKIHSLLYANRSKKLKSYLSEVDTTAVISPINKRNNQLILLLKSSVAIFIIALSSIYFYQTLSSTNLKTFVEEFSNDAYPAPGLSSGEEQDIDHWQQAIVYYSAKDYTNAISEITKIDRPTSEHKLYISLSEMYSNPPNYQRAIEGLLHIYDDPENMHQDATSWHLALAYLNSNQKEKAKILLLEISESKHYKNTEALKILKHFNSL